MSHTIVRTRVLYLHRVLQKYCDISATTATTAYATAFECKKRLTPPTPEATDIAPPGLTGVAAAILSTLLALRVEPCAAEPGPYALGNR